MTFKPGRTVLRRYWRAGRIGFLNAMRVVADDHRGLWLWQPIGGPYWRLRLPDGRTHHDVTIDRFGDAPLVEEAWAGSAVLVLMPPGRAWSVWWFFAPDGTFEGWYGNLEDPYARWDDGTVAGVDTTDHALDLWIEPDRSWRWKDEDELAERTGHPLYWTAAGAAGIRAVGAELARLAEAGTFPFDGAMCDFRPDPAWPLPTRPAGWDRPRA
jgi:hypothetical protein